MQALTTVTLRRSLVHAPLHPTSAFRAGGAARPRPDAAAAARQRASVDTAALAARRQLATVTSEPLSRTLADPLAVPLAMPAPSLSGPNSGLCGVVDDAKDLPCLAAASAPASGLAAAAPRSPRARESSDAQGGASPLCRASSDEEEAILLRVPAASRAVMTRLMRQRRAVHERTQAAISDRLSAAAAAAVSSSVDAARTSRLYASGGVPPRPGSGARLRDVVSAAVAAHASASDAPDASNTSTEPSTALERHASNVSTASEASSLASQASSPSAVEVCAALRRRAAGSSSLGSVTAAPQRRSHAAESRAARRAAWLAVSSRYDPHERRSNRPAPAVGAVGGRAPHASFTSPFFTGDASGTSSSLDEVATVDT